MRSDGDGRRRHGSAPGERPARGGSTRRSGPRGAERATVWLPPADASLPPVVSYVQVEPLVRPWALGEEHAETSPDLGLSHVQVALMSDGIRYPVGIDLRWEDAERIAREHNKCFVLGKDGSREVAAFSAETGWMRSLYPTAGAPTMLVSGLPMHRIKNTDPWRDSLAKVRALGPISGRVLDTATGLGYTAILAARTAEEVVTIELDPVGLELARENPWSRLLFTQPNLRQMVGDAAEVLPTLPDGSFSVVIHDPPMRSIGGDLYGLAFYRELYRVLRRGGRLFHYIGDPESPSGKRTTTGVLRRLQEAGFMRVTRHPEAFGLTAVR